MMKFSSAIKILVLALVLTSCTTVGGEFCANSGYQEKTSGYKQCTARYQANREFYEYCQTKRGVYIEGPQLEQCLVNAEALKRSMQQDRGFCQQEANTKFAPALSKAKEEKQPTLTESGDLVIGNIVLNSSYSPEERHNITAPFVNSCMVAHGWYNTGVWQEGKRNAQVQEITATLSTLNKQPVSLPVPEHNSVRLFTAAAEGNLYQLEQLINSGSADASTTNHQGYTALHVASRRGQFQVIQALLEKFGANPDALSHKGESAISLASYGKHHAIVNYITGFKMEQERQRILREQQNTFSRVNCHTTTQTTYLNGQTHETPVTLCQQPDGTWKEDPGLPVIAETPAPQPPQSNDKYDLDEAAKKLLRKWR